MPDSRQSLPAGSNSLHFRDEPHQLQDLVNSFLARSSASAGRGLSCEVDAQHNVVLRGVVRSYYQKQLIQEQLRQLPGVQRIQNEIEVIAR